MRLTRTRRALSWRFHADGALAYGRPWGIRVMALSKTEEARAASASAHSADLSLRRTSRADPLRRQTQPRRCRGAARRGRAVRGLNSLLRDGYLSALARPRRCRRLRATVPTARYSGIDPASRNAARQHRRRPQHGAAAPRARSPAPPAKMYLLDMLQLQRDADVRMRCSAEIQTSPSEDELVYRILEGAASYAARSQRIATAQRVGERLAEILPEHTCRRSTDACTRGAAGSAVALSSWRASKRAPFTRTARRSASSAPPSTPGSRAAGARRRSPAASGGSPRASRT